MQHRYVGDVGDFGKYALLNALAASGLRLGILWYLNEFEESNSDGKFISFNVLSSLDPQLWKKLRLIRTVKRNLSEIYTGSILPANAIFFDRSLPRPEAPCHSPKQRDFEEQRRRNWFKDGFEAISAAQLVFMDPDNGSAPPKFGMHRTRACKYAFECEVKALLQSGQSVVVYQHQTRHGTFQQQVERSMQRFADVAAGAFAVTFHAYALRAYIILPTNNSHEELLRNCSIRFLEEGWSRVFRRVSALQV